MTALDIYLWQQADSIQDIFSPIGFFFSFFGFVGVLISTIVIAVNDEQEIDVKAKSLRKWFIPLLAIGIVCHAACHLIPSSKTIAMMVAIPAIANSEPIQKDLPELYQLAKEALKEQIAGKK